MSASARYRTPSPTAAPDAKPCWSCARSGAALAVLARRPAVAQRRSLAAMVRRWQSQAPVWPFPLGALRATATHAGAFPYAAAEPLIHATAHDAAIDAQTDPADPAGGRRGQK